MQDIERTSLEAHVSLCELRYQQLERRFEEVHCAIDDLSTTVKDIQATVHAFSQNQQDRWSTAQIGIIGVLLTVVGALLAMQLA